MKPTTYIYRADFGRVVALNSDGGIRCEFSQTISARKAAELGFYGKVRVGDRLELEAKVHRGEKR